jgi:hypothetical protein
MIHLRTGKVLMFGFVTEGTNPVTGFQTVGKTWQPPEVFLDAINNTTDLFCSGHAALVDGRTLVVGGGFYWAFPPPAANRFDPASDSWAALPPMKFGRWYPTATVLPDGRVLATSGIKEALSGPSHLGANTPEFYDPDHNLWADLPTADVGRSLYPWMFVARTALTSGRREVA